MNTEKSKNLLIIIIGVLLIFSIFITIQYFKSNRESKQLKILLEKNNLNTAILDFNKLFIDNVLKSKGEIDFETRLKLENAVRDLKDKEVLSQWQKFTESNTEEKAQDEVKNLLEMLANKISY